MKSSTRTSFASACTFIFVLLVMLVSPMVVAQQQLMPVTPEGEAQPQLPTPLSEETVRDMVSRMSDDAVRALLIERLDAVAEREARDNASGSSAVAVLSDALGNYVSNSATALNGVDRIPALINTTRADIKAALMPGGFGDLFWLVLIGIVAGVIAERIVALALKRRKQTLINSWSTAL